MLPELPKKGCGIIERTASDLLDKGFRDFLVTYVGLVIGSCFVEGLELICHKGKFAVQVALAFVLLLLLVRAGARIAAACFIADVRSLRGKSS